MGWFDEGGSKSPVDVVALFDSAVPVLMAEVAAAGALVSFGTTSDGGAVGITVTLDGRWKREYFREAEAAQEWLAEALIAVRDDPGPPPAPSAPRQRRRRSPQTS